MHASSFDGDIRDFDRVDDSSELPKVPGIRRGLEDDSPSVMAREMVAAFERFTRSARSSGQGSTDKHVGAKKTSKKKKATNFTFSTVLASWLKTRRRNGLFVDPYDPDARSPGVRFKAALKAGFDRALASR